MPQIQVAFDFGLFQFQGPSRQEVIQIVCHQLRGGTRLRVPEVKAQEVIPQHADDDGLQAVCFQYLFQIFPGGALQLGQINRNPRFCITQGVQQAQVMGPSFGDAPGRGGRHQQAYRIKHPLFRLHPVLFGLFKTGAEL